MPWGGSSPNKTFTRSNGFNSGATTWQQDEASEVDIVADRHDNHDQDQADGISACLLKDGGNAATANLPMGGFRHTNVGAASAVTDYARFSDHQNGKGIYVPTVGGTGNAITLTTGYTAAAYAAGQRFSFIVGATNTGAVTVNVDGLGAKALVRSDGAHTALSAGDLVQNALCDIEYDGTRFHLMSSSATGTSADVLARIVKVGAILPWPSSTVPAGWLECYGQAVSRTTYAELFSTIGTIYGTGDGSTTFNLPDMRGRGIFGEDDMGGSSADRLTGLTNGVNGDTLGATGGLESTTLASDNIPQLTTSSGGAHAHSYTTKGSLTARGTGSVTAWQDEDSGTTSSDGAHAHTVGEASPTAINNLPPAIVLKWIILALPAAASASVLGTNGFLYNWDTGTTDADPGSGKLRVNHATLSSATKLYINETGANSEGLGAILGTWDDSTSTVRGNLYIYKVGAPGTFAYYQITGSRTDAGDYDKFDLTYVLHNGSLANGDNITVLFVPTGDKGNAGDAGTDGGIKFTYDSSTSMADPGTGDIRFNHGTLSSITGAAISDLSAESGNPDVSAYVLAWDDSTTTALRGTLLIREDGSPQNFVLFDVTGASTDNSGWTQLVLTYVAHSGSFSNGDTLLISFARSGNAGATGATGASGVDAGLRFNFDSSTSMADPGSGDIRLNNAAFASVTAIAVDDLSADTGNPDVSAFVLSWDDSTSTALRGTLLIKKISAPENFAIFSITGASTDNSGWTELAVSHVVSNGSFTNADALSLAFSRTGAKGTDGAGAGDVVGPSSSVDGEIALFDSTTGKLLKRASTTGLLKAASGVIAQAVAGTDYYNPGGTDVAIADGGTGASTAANAFAALKQAATQSATGVVEQATDAEVQTGTDTDRYITPAGLQACTGTETRKGVLELATDAETQTGTDTARAITPANLTAKEASTSGYLANTSDRILTTDQVWAAGALTALSDGANIAVDMATGINFSVTLAGNRALSNPSNTKVGQTGALVITQDGTGSRTLSYGTNYEFAGGTAFVLSTTASAKDVLFYWVQSSTSIIFTGILKAVS